MTIHHHITNWPRQMPRPSDLRACFPAETAEATDDELKAAIEEHPRFTRWHDSGFASLCKPKSPPPTVLEKLSVYEKALQEICALYEANIHMSRIAQDALKEAKVSERRKDD